MTNLEFNSVMETFKFDFIITMKKDTYMIGNTKVMYLSRKGEIINLPYDVQMILIEKYPELIKKLSYTGAIYLDDFRVSDKDDFAIVMYELFKYYDKYSFIVEDSNELDNYIAKINKKIIEKVIPSIGTYNWMKYDKINNDSFDRAMKKCKKSIFLSELRDLIDLFDETVNPYMVDDVKMDRPINYINKVDISGEILDEEDEELGYTRNNCCKFTITDKQTGNSVCYERYIDGFSTSFECLLDDGDMMVVNHSYHGNSKNTYDSGEVISIKYFEDGKIEEVNYNVTNDQAFYNTCEGVITCKLNMKEKLYLCWDLEEAINRVEKITVNNMTIKEKGKIFFKK